MRWRYYRWDTDGTITVRPFNPKWAEGDEYDRFDMLFVAAIPILPPGSDARLPNKVWEEGTVLYLDEPKAVDQLTDILSLPVTVAGLAHVHSLRLKCLLERLGIKTLILSTPIPKFDNEWFEVMESLEIGRRPAIQYIPVPLLDRERRRRLGTYYLAKFLLWVDCVDERRSLVVPILEQMDQVMQGREWVEPRIVLRREAIGEARVFRTGLDYVDWIVVREDVKEAMERAGITGCEFEEIEVV